MSESTAITFEVGYRRLQEIAEEVNQTEVPVDRMADLFAEAKGLDKALTDHLGAQKARIEQIERGEGIQAFTIMAPAEDEAVRRETATGSGDSDFEAPPPRPVGTTGEDDIPF